MHGTCQSSVLIIRLVKQSRIHIQSGMRKTYLIVLILFIASTHRAFPSDSFEGQYDMEFSESKETVQVSFWAKGGHLRMKLSGKRDETGEMIFRDGISAMIMVMPQQRMYMEMPIPPESFKTDSGEMDPEGFPFKETGNSKKILGMDAKEFVFEHEGESMTIWATDELGSMPFANNPMMKGWTDAMRRMTGLKAFFPLEMIGTENGKESYRMKVTKVERKSLPDSMFLPPEGFMKMTLPAGMGGFMPGG